MKGFNTLEAGLNQVVRAKTTRLHVALHTRNSDAKSGRELLKGLKDAASLLVCTQTNFLGWGVRVFLRVTS